MTARLALKSASFHVRDLGSMTPLEPWRADAIETAMETPP